MRVSLVAAGLDAGRRDALDGTQDVAESPCGMERACAVPVNSEARRGRSSGSVPVGGRTERAGDPLDGTRPGSSATEPDAAPGRRLALPEGSDGRSGLPDVPAFLREGARLG